MIKRMKAIGRKMSGNWVRKLHGCRPIHFKTSMTTPLTTHSRAITPARPANQVKALDSDRGADELEALGSESDESRGGVCEEGELLMTTTVPLREVAIGHAKTVGRCIMVTSDFRVNGSSPGVCHGRFGTECVPTSWLRCRGSGIGLRTTASPFDEGRHHRRARVRRHRGNLRQDKQRK